MITLIAAHDKYLGIGYRGNMPWGHTLKKDLQWFHDHTVNHIVLMGRKTFESIGKPLPNRINVVLTSNPDSIQSNSDTPVYTVSSIAEFINEYSNLTSNQFVIGGSELYRQFLPYASQLIITEIERKYKADTYFPPYDLNRWELTYNKTDYDENGTKLSFKIYTK